MRSSLLIGTLVLGLVALSAAALQKHEHGVARLDIAVDPQRVSIHFDSALDNLIGFEREPRSDAERAVVAGVLARLRRAEQLFRIDAAAACKLVKTGLVSAPLQLGATAAPAKDGHADLQASFDFNCEAGAKAGFVDLDLFEAFPRLQRIEVQVATPRGQMKAVLRRPQSRLALVR